MSDNNMTDQVAIVTGAARGFGLAISERLMQSGVRIWLGSGAVPNRG